MTEQQFIAKVEDLTNEVVKLIEDRAKKILLSGAIDLPAWENNYALPKCFISAMGGEIKSQFSPRTEDLKREVENIELFL